MAPFEARAGVRLTGTVSPALAGVAITVTPPQQSAPAHLRQAYNASQPHAEGALVVAAVDTDAKGEWEAGPLYDNIPYSVSADRPGYHFQADNSPSGGKDRAHTKGQQTVFSFVHKKLGQINVHVDGRQQLATTADEDNNGETDNGGRGGVRAFSP